MKYVEKIMQIFANILLFFAGAAILFSIIAFLQLKLLNNKYIDFFGYTIFSIATGSMSPTLEVDDVIIVKITNNVKVDDIITYYKEGDFITHRVISGNNGKFIAKGDYNNSSDASISKDMIVGKVIFIFPKTGLLTQVIRTPKVLISVIITVFLFSLCLSYIPVYKKRKRLELDYTAVMYFQNIDETKKKGTLNKKNLITGEKHSKIKIKQSKQEKKVGEGDAK